jgi:hypothetical protein
MLLRSATGHDFSQYKKSTLARRVERRMAQQGIDDAEVYARFLKEQPGELHVLFKELLINVTSFFRDPAVFKVLEEQGLLTARGKTMVVYGVRPRLKGKAAQMSAQPSAPSPLSLRARKATTADDDEDEE